MKDIKKNTEKKEFPGYPLYPKEEDIYNREERTYLSAEDPISAQGIVTAADLLKVDNDLEGNDLDVPGAELDDEAEASGNEDEENNYYSLGGDNHDD